MEQTKENIPSFISIVLVILSMTFAVRASNNMFVTSTPLLVKYVFDFSRFDVGILASLTALAMFIMSTFLNAPLESRRRRKVFIGSSLGYAIIFPFFAFSNFISIWIIMAVAGFTLGSIMPNIITSASLFKDRKVRERILSIYTLTLSLSLIMGPYIESEILKFVSLQQSFLVFSVFPAVALVDSIFIRFPEEKKKDVRALDLSVVRNDGFMIALLNILTYNVPFALLTTYGGLFGKSDFGLDYSTINLTFSAFFLTSFLSRLVFTFLAPQKLAPMMMISVSLTIIGLIILSTSQSYMIYVIAFLVLGVPHGFTYPVSVMSITRAFPAESRNAANSYFFSIMMAIGVVMPFISGEVVTLIGYRQTFLIIVPVVIVVFGFLLFFIRKSRKIVSVE
ncbi:MAG: MFS transporter [Candidatus Thermoplasmatota archaeon]|jgi:MFS family permease|nr:MFS transporter [Candidatus Thermoplasmatota archaeon]MCL5790591.1 MFS transporter [Candidatus Thermoplasmatota archaeon]